MQVWMDQPKVMKMKTRLKTHMYGHMENPPQNFKCSHCPNVSYSEYSGLYHHNRHYHRNIKPYVCSTCGKGFSLPSKLKAHAKEHSKKFHQCNECGQSFALDSTLHWHLRSVHGTDA